MVGVSEKSSNQPTASEGRAGRSARAIAGVEQSETAVSSNMVGDTGIEPVTPTMSM